MDEALLWYKKAVEVAPDEPRVYASLAYAYRAASNLDDRIAQYEKRVRAKPSDATSHYLLALLYEQKGEKDLAITEWKAFIILAPFGRLAEEARKHFDRR